MIMRRSGERSAHESAQVPSVITNADFIDYGSSFDKALLEDVLNIYFPLRPDSNASVVDHAARMQQERFGRSLSQSHVRQTLTPAKIRDILGMYAKFLFVYILVMLLTYYGVQTIGIFRFVSHKARLQSVPSGEFTQKIAAFIKGLGKACAGMILFSPAYVIAYAIRTEINTDTIFFMVLLGVISNGLLLTYANKFYTFLMSESRKGYVETAIAKNLHNDYSRKAKNGIRWSAIFALRKRFEGHVLDHVYRNARHQYIATVKEQASFLITGLIIIEMALNIHGYLNYEMLRSLLYKNYEIVVAIIVCIFYTVKCTDIFTDWLRYRADKRLEDDATLNTRKQRARRTPIPVSMEHGS